LNGEHESSEISSTLRIRKEYREDNDDLETLEHLYEEFTRLEY
jgi:hypothetical protein